MKLRAFERYIPLKQKKKKNLIINFFEKFFQEYQQSVKQSGTSSDPTLIGCKGYQHLTLVGKSSVCIFSGYVLYYTMLFMFY